MPSTPTCSGHSWTPFRLGILAAGRENRRRNGSIDGVTTGFNPIVIRCRGTLVRLVAVSLVGWSATLLAGEGTAVPWPALPATNGAVELPAQEWPLRPGPRAVRVQIHYPDGTLRSVTRRTGILLTLHNWGGTDCVGTADPEVMAREFDLVALCVNYLQSGRAEAIDDQRPYDFGWLQALDALRAMGYLRRALAASGHPFHDGRYFAVGGSGGANVALMANKLAPRSFAGVVALSGMTRLSDDIAFGDPGGSPLSARWIRDPGSPYYLSPAAQEIRFVGHPGHLAEMKRLGSSAHLLIVHGVEDPTCPVADARELVDNLQAAGLPVEPVWVDASRVDGRIFRAPDHALGDRTQIVRALAADGLRPEGPGSWVRQTPSDFELNQEVRYPTRGGTHVIMFRDGIPEGRFEPGQK